MSKKFFVALALLVAVAVAGSASAVTVAELQAQIAALTAQLAALGGTTAASNSSVPTITKSLTLGSRGDEVSALQQYLIDEGLLNVEAPTGYFGAMTKAAVVAWQKANGVTPASGYFGPISRAALATLGTTSTGTGTTGTGTTSTGTTGIATPGVEGSLTVTTNPTPGSGQTVREGDLKKAVLGLKLEAKLGDVAVQRVKVDLGSSTVIYNKLFSRIYVMDGSTVLAESALNSSTVVKDGSTYYITLTGFNLVVPKDGTKVLTLAVDALPSIESTYAVSTYGLLIPADGVRGVDGAGLTQSGPTSALSRRTVTIDANALVDNASLVISTNSASMPTQQIIATQNSDGDEYDKLPLLTFNLKGEKDALKVTDLVAGITRGGGTVATATTAYLYDGDTLVGSATVEGTSATAMTATFSDIDYIVPADSTKVLTLKVDIRDADSTATTFIGDVTAGANVTVENSTGTSITETGTATGYTITILDSGLELSLVSIATDNVSTVSDAGLSTSTYSAVFNIKAKAVGGSIVLPTAASDTPMFAKTGATNSFKVYVDGAASSITAQSTSTDYTIPNTCLTTGLTNGCTLAEDSEVTIPVRYTFVSRNAAGTAISAGSYAVQMIKVNYGATVTTSTFMANDNAWRSASRYIP